jgi:hypothetical protein
MSDAEENPEGADGKKKGKEKKKKEEKPAEEEKKDESETDSFSRYFQRESSRLHNQLIRKDSEVSSNIL